MPLTLNGKTVKSEMDRRGWKLATLAERAGIANSTASQAINDKKISADAAMAIAKAFADNPPDPDLARLLGEVAS